MQKIIRTVIFSGWVLKKKKRQLLIAIQSLVYLLYKTLQFHLEVLCARGSLEITFQSYIFL